MFTTVMVPLDTSAIAERALPTAAAIAGAAGATLRLVLVHEPIPGAGCPDAPWNAARSSMEGAYLDGKAGELSRTPGAHVTRERRVGPAAETIADVATSSHADLVVMTTHGRTGLSRAWLGSVADSIVRWAGVPVLMLRPSDDEAAPTTFRRVMIPLDESPRAECIVDSAVALGGSNATYVLIEVVAPVPIMLSYADPYAMTATIADPEATDRAVAEARKYLERVAQRLRARGIASIEEHVVTADHAAPALLHAAKAHNVDLIAIGTHGRGSSRLLLGSVADKLLRGARTPLLVCRQPRAAGGAAASA